MAESQKMKVALNRDWTGMNIDISQTTEMGLRLMREDKDAGATLITFPELWFPGFPKWREQNDWKKTHLASYIENSLEIGSHEWNTLVDGIVRGSGNYIYMAQALISRDGEVVMHLRKLRPSGSERGMFSDGTVDQLRVVNTPLGRVGMLQCGEHFYPSMNFVMAAQRPKLHIGAWPFALNFDDDTYSIFYNATLVTRGAGSYALNSGAYVLMPSVGYCFIYDALMRIVAAMENDVDYQKHSILYHTLDISDLHDTQDHDPDAQASWAVLQQLDDAFPATIPHEQGSLVPRRETSIEYLTSTDMKWSESAPGTPWPENLAH
ncbi:aliphatic nitrilase [Aspergillus eucalypticola CBS 122712]|uniref:Aliphatic nitrilase n=1 Tax=Aspergillus eucalypticola (strain CBS 122712 / IBT 29274) TaxID=1448314 RepID=A0A317V996_ASPEC|nr:aliphatic nitrilase [Aspergillus eucalypticola CBS 122712]PWY69969.1 aliphatic nitrilase [Aspergillus eucalypticola CBS 122712]